MVAAFEGKTVSLLVILFFCYVGFGGFIVHMLEKDQEKENREISDYRNKEWISKYSSIYVFLPFMRNLTNEELHK